MADTSRRSSRNTDAAHPGGIERRELLKRLAVLVGATLSPACVTFLRGGETPPLSKSPAPVLDVDERELLASACEAILPATDTPGARGAGVPEFVEWMLQRWLEPDEAAAFRAGLARLDAMMRQRFDVSFVAAGEDAQHTVLSELEREALSTAKPGGPSLLGEWMGTWSAPPTPFFSQLKELVIVGYYTSEIGATEELARFVAVDYEPCIPYADLGRAWSE